MLFAAPSQSISSVKADYLTYFSCKVGLSWLDLPANLLYFAAMLFEYPENGLFRIVLLYK